MLKKSSERHYPTQATKDTSHKTKRKVVHLPSMPKREKDPQAAIPLSKKLYEMMFVSPISTDLIRQATRIYRSDGVSEVICSTESGKDARWLVIANHREVEIPNAEPVLRSCGIPKPKVSGHYAKMPKGDWVVGMTMVPFSDENLEREKFIRYRHANGINIAIANDKINIGFVMAVASPHSGTLVCQKAMMDLASQAGIRCEIAYDPLIPYRVNSILTI